MCWKMCWILVRNVLKLRKECAVSGECKTFWKVIFVREALKNMLKLCKDCVDKCWKNFNQHIQHLKYNFQHISAYSLENFSAFNASLAKFSAYTRLHLDPGGDQLARVIQLLVKVLKLVIRLAQYWKTEWNLYLDLTITDFDLEFGPGTYLCAQCADKCNFLQNALKVVEEKKFPLWALSAHVYIIVLQRPEVGLNNWGVNRIYRRGKKTWSRLQCKPSNLKLQ